MKSVKIVLATMILAVLLTACQEAYCVYQRPDGTTYERGAVSKNRVGALVCLTPHENGDVKISGPNLRD